MNSITIPYRKDIQGLRAISVIAVMIYHFNNSLLPGGYLGVDIFFVISGFLMMNILLSYKFDYNQSFINSITNFYYRRLKRIVPAYYIMLIVISIFAGILFTESDFENFKKSLIKAIYFFSNNYFASFGDYFAPDVYEQPLLHTWSLAIEMQFYLLFPLLVLLMPYKWLRYLLPFKILFFFILSIYIFQIKGKQQEIYYALYTRIPEFFAGALIVLFKIGQKWTTQQANKIWIFGIIIILFGFLSNSKLFPYSILLAILGSTLIISSNNASILRYLQLPWLVWIGELSYSLYLWHWPLLSFIRYFVAENKLSFLLALVYISFTLLFSVVSYYYIEKRFHKSHFNIKSHKKIFAYLTIILLGISSVKIGSIINNYFTPPPLPEIYKRYADPESICHGKIVGDCIRGDSNSSYEILVIGDSHAAMLNLFFDKLGKELGFKARVMSASGCIPIPGFDYKHLPEWARDPCQNMIKQTIPYIKNATVLIIAGKWSYHLQRPEFVNALKSFFEGLDKRVYRIFIMPQIKQLDGNPLRIHRFRHIGFPIKIKDSLKAEKANEVLYDIIKPFIHVNILNLKSKDLFINVPFYKNELIYYDNHHINEVGARYYAEITQHDFANSILPILYNKNLK